MGRAVRTFGYIFIFCFGHLFASQVLSTDDIQPIMKKFFHYHVETKDFTPDVIRRSFKIYIERFDPDKSYLTEKEVLPYIKMSNREARKIISKIKSGDFSDYIQMNAIIQNAIRRTKKMRASVAQELAAAGVEGQIEALRIPPDYAKSEKDLRNRQYQKLARFLKYHEKKTEIGDSARRGRVFALLEKKMQRHENPYLNIDSKGQPLSKARVQHLLALHILKAMSKSLDAHTAFFSEEEAYEMRMNLEKQFEGVGVVLSEGIDGVVVADMLKGSPAHQSGKIAVNDVLVEIDGKSVIEMSFDEVLNEMKKRDKSEIVLGLARNQNQEFFRVTLEKRPIVMEDDRLSYSSEAYGDGIIGKITLNSFYENSDGISSEKDIRNALRELKKQGPLMGLVLDLRDNAGGFLSQAVKVAGLFITSGVVVISKYSKGEVHYLRNVDGKSFYNGPLIILTSKMSASASEIVAQALQDYGVALIVGDNQTFGKGSIQYQTVTDSRANIYFKVTVGKYYTVSGKTSQLHGVQADIEVPSNYAPYSIGERFLEYPLSNDRVPAAYKDPLTDLDERSRIKFQKFYLPHVQRKVTFWQQMLPILKKNSNYRIAHDENFQFFLKRQEQIRSKLNGDDVIFLDDTKNYGVEDIQMIESVNILKDMILLEAEKRRKLSLSSQESLKAS